jgi:hypothetical protein
MAAKTLVSAVDAATAPSPTAGTTPADSGADSGRRRNPRSVVEVERPAGISQSVAGRGAGAKAARAVVDVREAGRGLKRGGKRFGEAVWGPVARLSGVLWLELTGVFFGLFAVSAGVGAWKMWGTLRQSPGNGVERTHLLVALAVAGVFGYFCLSSFVRAHRRERGR